MTPVIKVRHHMVTANRASLSRSSEVHVRSTQFLPSICFPPGQLLVTSTAIPPAWFPILCFSELSIFV